VVISRFTAGSAAIPIIFIEKSGEPKQMEREVSIFYRAHDPIDKDHLGPWIAHRLTEAGVACDRAHGMAIAGIGDRTQDIIQYADEVFSRGQGSGQADDGVLEEALRSLLRKEHERYLRTWENLTSNQRIGLRAIASGVKNLYAHGSGLPIPPSSLHRVVEALHSRRILTDGVGDEEVDDPFFREWILRYAMPDSVPHELLQEDQRKE